MKTRHALASIVIALVAVLAFVPSAKAQVQTKSAIVDRLQMTGYFADTDYRTHDPANCSLTLTSITASDTIRVENGNTAYESRLYINGNLYSCNHPPISFSGVRVIPLEDFEVDVNGKSATLNTSVRLCAETQTPPPPPPPPGASYPPPPPPPPQVAQCYNARVVLNWKWDGVTVDSNSGQSVHISKGQISVFRYTGVYYGAIVKGYVTVGNLNLTPGESTSARFGYTTDGSVTIYKD